MYGESWLVFQELTSVEMAIMKPSHVPKSTFGISVVRYKIKCNTPALIQRIVVVNSAFQPPGSR